MPRVIEMKNTVADPDPVIVIEIVIVTEIEIVTEIVIDVAAQDPDPGQEIAIGTKDVIVLVQEIDVVQVSEIMKHFVLCNFHYLWSSWCMVEIAQNQMKMNIMLFIRFKN